MFRQISRECSLGGWPTNGLIGQRFCFDEYVLDVFVLLADSLFEALHRRVSLRAGQVLAELHVHGQQYRMWSEIHRQRPLDRGYCWIRFRHLLDAS